MTGHAELDDHQHPFASPDSAPASISDQGIDAGGGPPLPGRARSSGLSPRSRKRPLRVPTVIIDRSALFRAGLTHVLAGSRFRVTAGFSKLCDLPENAFGDQHCMVLIGLDNEAKSVLSSIASLAKQHKSLRIITLSDQFHPEELLAVIESGGGGYLVKSEISPDALLKSLELVLLGGIVVPQGFAKLLTDRGQVPAPLPLDAVSAANYPAAVAECGQPQPASDAPQSDDLGRLSNREQMILIQLTQGASNKHIAREFNIAEATVKVHVKSLLRKIRVSNRTQAAMWAIDHVGPDARPKAQPLDPPNGRNLGTASAM